MFEPPIPVFNNMPVVRPQRKDDQILVRVPEELKTMWSMEAAANGLSLSDYIRRMMDFARWALSPIELKVAGPTGLDSQKREYIDIFNASSHEVVLGNYMLFDSTFDRHHNLSDRHPHTFRFSSIILEYATGSPRLSILAPGEIFRLYTQPFNPNEPFPPNVRVRGSMGLVTNIWNKGFDNITFMRIAQHGSETVLGGLSSSMRGLIDMFANPFNTIS